MNSTGTSHTTPRATAVAELSELLSTLASGRITTTRASQQEQPNEEVEDTVGEADPQPLAAPRQAYHRLVSL